MKISTVNKLKNAFATVQFEGNYFSSDQKEFIQNLVERINRKDITLEEAIEIIILKHGGKRKEDN